MRRSLAWQDRPRAANQAPWWETKRNVVRGARRTVRLTTQAETADKRAIPPDVAFSQVVEQAPPLAHKTQ